jgi:hypothetical protein
MKLLQKSLLNTAIVALMVLALFGISGGIKHAAPNMAQHYSDDGVPKCDSEEGIGLAKGELNQAYGHEGYEPFIDIDQAQEISYDQEHKKRVCHGMSETQISGHEKVMVSYSFRALHDGTVKTEFDLLQPILDH